MRKLRKKEVTEFPKVTLILVPELVRLLHLDSQPHATHSHKMVKHRFRCLHAVPSCSSLSSLLWDIQSCDSTTICPFTLYGHFSCFWGFAIMDSTVINCLVHTPGLIYSFQEFLFIIYPGVKVHLNKSILNYFPK